MDDLGHRIRRANPHAGRPLPDHALKTLDDIIAGRRTPASSAPSPAQAHARAWRPALIAASGFVAVAALLAVVILMVFRPQPAMATTPLPLPIQPTTATLESIREELMKPSPNPDGSQTRRGAEWEGWFLQLDLDRPTATFIQPQRTQVEWDLDRSGTSRVTAGTPATADGTPIKPIPESAAEPGSTLYEERWGPGQFSVPFPETPPDTADAMREYLAGFLYEQGLTDRPQPTAGEYLFAVSALTQVWTLGDAAQRAAIEVIVTADGAAVAGDTVDRAGRPGVVLDIAPSEIDPGHRSQLVIDITTCRLLAVERITVDGLPEFDVPPDSVTDYTLWR